jgi:hypothetical protein
VVLHHANQLPDTQVIHLITVYSPAAQARRPLRSIKSGCSALCEPRPRLYRGWGGNPGQKQEKPIFGVVFLGHFTGNTAQTTGRPAGCAVRLSRQVAPCRQRRPSAGSAHGAAAGNMHAVRADGLSAGTGATDRRAFPRPARRNRSACRRLGSAQRAGSDGARRCAAPCRATRGARGPRDRAAGGGQRDGQACVAYLSRTRNRFARRRRRLALRGRLSHASGSLASCRLREQSRHPLLLGYPFNPAR